MLMKRRTFPCSSRRWGLSSGKRVPSESRRSLSWVAEHWKRSTFSVWRRKAVGMETVTFILCRPLRGTGVFQFTLEILFESGELGRDRLRGSEAACQGVGGLQAVAGDAEHGRVVRLDAPLSKELA